jgi:RimJ/RimL family protein N-acetyltransferase
MVEVFADPALYAFIGGEPPSFEALTARYRAWVAGSPRAGETWWNWVIRLRDGGTAIGHVQATVIDAERSADIAWTVGTAWQGRGYATEAAKSLVDWLPAQGVAVVTAHIHPGHAVSARVAAKVGLQPSEVIEDGEVVWRRVVRPIAPVS